MDKFFTALIRLVNGKPTLLAAPEYTDSPMFLREYFGVPEPLPNVGAYNDLVPVSFRPPKPEWEDYDFLNLGSWRVDDTKCLSWPTWLTFMVIRDLCVPRIDQMIVREGTPARQFGATLIYGVPFASTSLLGGRVVYAKGTRFERGLFCQTNMVGAYMRDATLCGTALAQCQLTSCNLAYSLLSSALIENCRSTVLDLGSATIRKSVFAESTLVGTRLSGATIEDTRFLRCSLRDTDMRGTSLRNVVFDDCDLTGALREPEDDPIPGWRLSKSDLTLCRSSRK